MQIKQGVQLHTIKTEKFKDIGIHIRFCNVLDEKVSPARSLLALMLCDRCEKYDTKMKMSTYLDMMYGALINAQTVGYGQAQVVELRCKIMNPSYVKEENTMLEDIFTFLHEIVFAPLLNEDVFQESKLMLMAKVERMQDEPSQYVVAQALKLAGKGTPLGTSTLGELSIIEQLSLEDVKEAYRKMIEEDAIDMIVCGDVEQAVLLRYISKHLQFKEREHHFETFYCVKNAIHDAYVEEYKNISQSNIMMVYFTNTSILDTDYYALRVANAMLGQYSTSLLFQEVREKHSLCYSINSNLISYDGALCVMTGVEKANIEKTITLIKKQFQRICDGDFDDDLCTVSKQMIQNSLKASKDSMYSLMALEYQNDLLGCQRTSEDIIELIARVKREDVLAVLQKCELAMTFVLTKEDAHEDNNQ